MAEDPGASAALDELRASYETLFGFVPEIPAQRFDALRVDAPEFLLLVEQTRAHAMYSDVFDVKTSQLLAFMSLLTAGHFSAHFHALAARRAGATWQELTKVVELAYVTGGGLPMLQRANEILLQLAAGEEQP